MASPTQWTWVWINSGSWWWTGRPRLLRFMGLQRVGHDWVTEQNWWYFKDIFIYLFLAVLGLPCCAGAFSSCSERGLIFVATCGLLVAVLLLWAQALGHGLSSCPSPCGNMVDQGWNPCPQHWQGILCQWTTREAPHWWLLPESVISMMVIKCDFFS